MNSFLLFLVANIPFFFVLVILAVKIKSAVKNGVVKEICGLISIVVASILVVLISFAVKGYFYQDKIKLVVAIVLILLLLIIYRVIEIGLTTLKLVSKLPVVSFLDKILGIPCAIAEVVIAVWAVYCMIMILDAGAFEYVVRNCIENNKIMAILYDNNYMYPIVSKWDGVIRGWEIWSKIGIGKQ